MTNNKGYEFLDIFLPTARKDFFYKEHYICVDEEYCQLNYNPEFEKNFELLYKDYYDLKSLHRMDKQELSETIWNKFRDMLEDFDEFYEPLIYDAKIAIECGLLPFTWDRSDEPIDLLACGDFGDNFYIKDLGDNFYINLSAYQLLTSKTIDKGNKIFTDPDSFKKVLGYEVYNKMQEILGCA